jgi:hypothetical protein
MQNLSSLQKMWLNYLGYMYALAYFTTHHRLLGLRLSSWLRFLSLALVVIAWTRGWGTAWLAGALLLAAWLNVTYWRAGRAGYNKFVPDEAAVLPTEPLSPLPPNQRVPLQATGIFSVNNREDFALLRPAEYWQAPLGDHIVMVQQRPGQFRYQFFTATSLQEIHVGWLIYGRKPHRALAVSFLVMWGPDFNELTQVYMTHHNSSSSRPLARRTVYFTFDEDATRRAVWHNLVYDARQARIQS